MSASTSSGTLTSRSSPMERSTASAISMEPTGVLLVRISKMHHPERPAAQSISAAWRVGRTKRAAVEIRLSREFRRAYHDYATHIPSQGSVIEWLALMQHHGAPTRLLDFSYSVYVAAYFPLCQDP